MQNIMQQVFWGNKLIDYTIATAIFLGSLIVIGIFKAVFLRRIKAWAQKTANTFDDFLMEIVEKILIPLFCFGAFYASINILILIEPVRRFIDIAGLAVLTLFTVRLATLCMGFGFEVYLAKKGKDISLERSLDGILRVIKLIVWGLAIVFFLDNLGFKISAVIAGLGIGGVAVALAAQAVLKDVFSYFCIIFDRPFAVGDFIIIGEFLGTVEHIGIKTSRIRSLSGEQLIFSNTDLTDSRVRNYKRMEKRRVLFKFGVIYQTPVKQLREIPQIVKDIINRTEGTVFDRAHFSAYGDFSLNFEVVYYVLSSEYNKYMDVHQQINFALKEEFEKRKIEFAYPTQTVYVEK